MKKIYLLLCSIVFILSTSVAAMALGVGVYGEMSTGGASMLPMGGLVFDSALAKNKIFNNRFKFGGGQSIGGADSEIKVGFSNTFGLSPSNMRGDGARFWFGPRLGAYYISGKTEVPGMFFGTETEKYDQFRLDLGLVLLGFNFNFGQHATVSFEFGGDYGVTIGDGNTSSGYNLFTNISFMFRFNDTYTGKQAQL